MSLMQNKEAKYEAQLHSIQQRWPDWQANLFDLNHLPFSFPESFLCISTLAHNQVWLRNVRGGDERNDDGKLFHLQLLNLAGEELNFSSCLSPDSLRLQHGDASAEICFADGDTLLIRLHKAGLRLSMQAQSYDYVQTLNDAIHVSNARQDLSVRIQQKNTRLTVDAPWQGQKAERIRLEFYADKIATNPVEESSICLHVYRILPTHEAYSDFHHAQQQAQNSFQTWLQDSLPSAEIWRHGRFLAAYITWSCLVPAAGQLRAPAMYMSKNWMVNIWSWDHCFNALALGTQQTERAWQQMKILFDHQHASGRLPDFINDQYAYWRFTQPPVHGWTFAQLRRMAPAFYTKERCRQVLQWLSLQAHSWLDHGIHGLPVYDHGNDAGWDNSTVFLKGTPLHSPDLITFLILQCEEIAALHEHLHEYELASVWHEKAQQLQKTLIDELWRDGRFQARHAITQEYVDVGHSLIAFLPLLLGERLPQTIRQQLLHDLKAPQRFITAHGLATEACDSIYYHADGYWRGPIWAPVMALMCDALCRCDEHALAQELAHGFLNMAQHTGMAENFDAQSGQGLRDRAFTWTSSVFLLLAHQHSQTTE